MGSIALPALDIHPPAQQTDPVTQIGRMMQLSSLLKSQPIQNAIQQNQLQQSNIQTQMLQQQQNDQQAANAAVQDWQSTDPKDLVPLMKKHGASLQSITNTQNLINKMGLEAAQRTEAEQKVQSTKNNTIAQAYQNVLDLPPEQQPQAYDNYKKELVQNGYLTPQQAAAHQYTSPQQLDAERKILMGQNAVEEEAYKKAQTAKDQASAGEIRYKVMNGAIYDTSGGKLTLANPSALDPTAWKSLIDQTITGKNNQALHDRTLSQVNFFLQQGNMEAAQKVLTEASQQVGSIEKATNPAVISAEVGKQVAGHLGEIKGEMGLFGAGMPSRPAGATHDVYATDGTTVIGYVVDGKFVPRGKQK